jgi:ATP-dependent DNA helicase RecQ
MTIEAALRHHWGYDSFRPLQEEAVEAVIAGRDLLLVLPTGGGKSLCYQLPAAVGNGIVLVVSPLIALMDDQVAAARQAGIVADAFHSNLETGDRSDAYRRLENEETQLLYVSPERLLMGDLMGRFGHRLTMVAVDEAHCVSHWGHEFRPEYRRLQEALNDFPDAVRMALTATATPVVRDDICSGIGLREPLRLVGHPDRPNLVYRAFPRTDQAAQVRAAVKRHPGEGGIVYAQTRKQVERLAKTLDKAGVSCAPYHAGLDPEHRRRVQDDFVNERLDVVVATIAFGMGIDRSNVRFVIHANTPRSVEHYQQESGRAGRDGLPADCTLLFSVSDLVTHRRLAESDGPLAPERKASLERQLRDIGRYAAAPVCRHRLLSEHFHSAWPPPGNDGNGENGCGACDVCLDETSSLTDDEALLTSKKILSAAWRMEGRYGSGYVVKLLIGKGDERAERLGHDRLQVFGILEDAGEGAVRWWVDQLVVQGFLEVDDETGYPLLRITTEGRALCKDEGTVRLGVPPKRAKKVRRGRAASAGVDSLGDADRHLFERLRELRRNLAAEQGVPPYVVFPDTTLVEMATDRPKTLDELHDVKGVGDRRLERYGEDFLEVLLEETA